MPGKEYYIKHTTHVVSGSIKRLHYRIDVNTLHRQDAAKLDLNEIGRCSVSLASPIYFDGYKRNRSTGSFIIIDRITNVTVAAGMVLHRSASEEKQDYWVELEDDQTVTNVASKVTPEERQTRLSQKPVTILLTGKPGSGKSTIARALERKLFAEGYSSVVLDGPQIRQGISKDLDFSFDDRSENLRRATEIAKLINQAGQICILSMVAPSESVRQKAATSIGSDQFVVVHINPSDSVIDSWADVPADQRVPYEDPSAPDCSIDTGGQSVPETTDQIFELLREKEFLL